MVFFRIQLVACVALVISSIALGSWLKRHPSNVVAKQITPIIHLIFIAYLLSFLMALAECSNYDGILGFPSLPFRSELKFVATVMINLGVLLMVISVLCLKLFGYGLPGFLLSEKLATKNLYSLTRNPMSLGFHLTCIAIPLLIGSTFFTLWTLMVIIPSHIVCLKYFEERELESRFGQPYIEYKKKVPFLIPNFYNIIKSIKRAYSGK